MKRASEVAPEWGEAASIVGWAASLGYPDHEPLPESELRSLRKSQTRLVRNTMRRQLRDLGLTAEEARGLLP